MARAETTDVIIGDELSDVGDGEGSFSSSRRVRPTVVLDDADPALELGHRLVELPPFQHHVFQLHAASTQLRPRTIQTRRDLTHCTTTTATLLSYFRFTLPDFTGRQMAHEHG